MTATAILLGSTVPPALLPDVSRAAEASGFSRIWMSEDYFMTGGVAGAAIALGATTTIPVGIGLLPIYVRHPALTAMEAGAIAGAHPGRFTLGFGAGVFGWLDQIGVPHPAPLGTMRDTVRTVKALLNGERLNETGKFVFDDVALAFPPAEAPPVFIGATGPKMTALSGEIADGVLISVLSTPAFVHRTRTMVADAAAAAGREPGRITALAIFSLADTVAEARAAARPVISGYLSHGANELTDSAGVSDELTAILQRGGRAALEEEMADEWVDLLSISGDAATCRAALERLEAAGASEIALMPVDSTDLPRQLEEAGRALELLPRH
jgi:5,10-methylenetetrahydromethanopterin reductase